MLSVGLSAQVQLCRLLILVGPPRAQMQIWRVFKPSRPAIFSFLAATAQTSISGMNPETAQEIGKK